MKRKFLLSSKAWVAFVIAGASLTILLASCKKNDPVPEPVGEARVKHVNAVEGSAAQELYVNNAKLTTSAVAYGSNSDYLVFTSGISTFASADAGATTANASAQGNVQIGSNLTAIYYINGDGTKVLAVLGDDMTTASGKAKVRFININSFLKANIAVALTGGSNLIPSVGYETASNYIQVDAGTKFTLSAAGVITAPVVDGTLQAGKNYTIWIDGSSATELRGHVILQN
ncbi:DUF4397 domain-containing protein [Pedobacter heparinus]|uniref:DUF4397 domain-containing protein n=1 Tax=Pedobacter heparinus TaxID=984 RepID=UPI0029313B6B|nr:DUF4397 domain-containing protein [Pedobacter heparinus]